MVSNVNFTHSGSVLNLLKHKWMYSNNLCITSGIKTLDLADEMAVFLFGKV